MKVNKFKKGIAELVSVVMLLNVGISIPIMAGPTTKPFNYAEAFQKSMYFYDANKCGPGVTGGRLSWRGDCHTEDAAVPLVPVDKETGIGTNLSANFIEENRQVLDPDGDGSVDLRGGFHDAGDHVKFGLPQSYAGSTLGWGYYEFRDSYVKVGEQDHIEDILRWFNDYFLRSTFRDKDGKVVAFAYQVGDGTTDHNYLNSPELQTTTRPAFFATKETPASDQCAGAAASLAINYLNFKDSDPTYAAKSLDTAKALYEFAKENRGLGFSGGFYNSSYDEDEMSWAAVWLNIATGNMDYINDITSVDENGVYTGYMQKIISTTSSTWQNIWVHSWDTVWGGVFAKLAPITNNPEHWYFFRWNIEYWSDVPHEEPNDHTFLEGTPGGFKVVNTWGSARYDAAAQLCALVYNKYKPNEDFVKWSKSQMDYILGDNPMNRCYEVGYSDISAVNPHHRAANGSTTNSMDEPEIERHKLWGALVGGPDETDYHLDAASDYVYNEVAIDYNAGFVGALAGLYEIYGKDQEPLANFPIDEVDEMPFYATAKIEQENSERTQVTVKVHNDTSCPPRYEDGLTARYYFDISEMVSHGQSIDDLSVQVMYDQASAVDGIKTEINGPYVWDADKNIYYVELDWSKNSFHGDREIHFGLVPAQDTDYTVHWDYTNDWSHEGLTKEESLAQDVPVYLRGTKVFGMDPQMVKLNITNPVMDSTVDFTKEQTPIDLTANVVSTDTDITKVIFYANGEEIGTATKAPYTVSYLPTVKENVSTEKINVTAKAFNNEDEVATATTHFNVMYKEPEPAVLTFSTPFEGNVVDATSKPQSVTFTAASTGVCDDIEKITIYANDEIVDEATGTKCTATYTTPDSESDEPLMVTFKAVATLKDGSTKESDPVILMVKLPIKISEIEGIDFKLTNNSEPNSNTIGLKCTLTNNSMQDLDLSKFSIRYYYTREGRSAQTFFSDNSGIQFNKAPWYLNATDNVTSKFVDLNNPVEDADTYIEIGFKDIDELFSNGTSLNLEGRIANSNWADYDQTNDFSYANGATLLYNGTIIAGTIPQ